MARILTALNRRDTQPAAPVEPVACLHDPCAVDEPTAAPPDEETPFIEIGPRRMMEASPSVLAAGKKAEGSVPRLVLPEAVASPLVQEAKSTQPAPLAKVAELPTSLARSKLAPELIAYHRPEHPASRHYRQLLAPLLAAGPLGKAQVLLFTSTRPRCGATTVLLNVAIAAAAQGKRVVVLDGNLRRPALADRLGLDREPGWRDVLGGSAALEHALRETDQANLWALTAGAEQPRQGVRFVAETIRSLLRQLRQRFDLVLVDGPRWDAQPDVLTLAAVCDAVLVVVPEAEAESPQVADLYEQIPTTGARLAGCILAGV